MDENPYESPDSRAERPRAEPDQNNRFRGQLVPATLLSFYGCFTLLVGTYYIFLTLFTSRNSDIDANRMVGTLLFLAASAPLFLIGLTAMVAAWGVWRKQFLMGTALGILSVAASPVVAFYVLMLCYPYY